MEKSQCPKFETCSAALCQHDLTPRMFWYADTEVCRSASAPKWVKIQRRIAKLNPDPHRWYTVKMLEAIQRVDRNTSGIVNVGYSASKENEWLLQRKNYHQRTKTQLEHAVTSLAFQKHSDKTGFLGVNRQNSGGLRG